MSIWGVVVAAGTGSRFGRAKTKSTWVGVPFGSGLVTPSLTVAQMAWWWLDRCRVVYQVGIVDRIRWRPVWHTFRQGCCHFGS